ncbi:MAG: hypothetical protein H7Y38_16085, partial [Armatimonadetes bacterium]|nr:hypothetical protein [Armatimonadota bacterium]
MKSAIRFVVCLGILAAISANVEAQEPSLVSPTAPVSPPVTAAAPLPTATVTRTVEAVIGALDAKANTLSLQVPPLDKSGTPQAVLAVPDSKCRFLKNNRAALLSDFAVGDKVVVRLTYRTLPVASVVVREMADTASYAEKQKQGKEITEGKIQSVSAKELVVRRADGVDVTFRVSAKTVVTKVDALVSLAAYPVGSSVVV